MLEKRVCVVTGAAAGIGRETAIEMARRGAEAVVAVDRDEAGAAETAALVEAAGAVGLARAVDITSSSAVRDLMDEVGGRFGRIDVLHNNAGVHETVLTARPRLEDIEEDVFDRVYEVNLKGVWLGIKHATPHLKRSTAGAIVNASSLSGLVGFEGAGIYCATKGAVILLTKVAALELAQYGIRCNCYCPAAVDTAMARGHLENPAAPAAAARTLVASQLVERMGTPAEIASLVCFLASEQSSFINGAAVPIDGGATAWRGLHGS